MSKYIAESYAGVFYKIHLEEDNYELREGEIVLKDEMEALSFPLPCRWNEETEAWEYAEPNLPQTPIEEPEPGTVPEPEPTDTEVLNTLLGVSE